MGQLERKFRERKLKQQDIINAAEQVFAKKNYEEAVIDEIAGAAEFSKKTLYVYFSSKEEIYLEVALRGYRQLLEIFKENILARNFVTPIEKLQVFLHSIFILKNDFPVYLTAIIFFEQTDFSGLHLGKRLKNKYHELNAEVLDIIRDTLIQGCTEKYFCSELANKQSAATVWSFIIGVVVLDKYKKDYLQKYQHIEAETFMEDSFEALITLLKIQPYDFPKNKAGQ
ncbi:TetR/AcrR family transcriptional regulator [Liquorilactobacillus oeni]|uniref:HTH tetR-type domain-containing protein n=1 Tax=Liquorilactobacillus oeni DSM 19972 TaxID=1423777 RepID=A0A0R1MIM1_9LACO|nr:TetR/AcrR family transcriptional regulator [Liquorilactobacillus oeni]KRL04291.1 hypothetical protein FD46_GL001416 [Liquorilactobacillus oeni DSM 19972]